MNQEIFDAIKNRCVLKFNYDGYPRIVIPHAYGISRAGNEIIRCYQTGGLSHSGTPPCWRLMEVNKIQSLTMTEEHFEGESPGYVKGDRGMTTIFCEL